MNNAHSNETETRVVRRHHWLVRLTHWLNVPLLLGLVLTGISIYWASPVFLHRPASPGSPLPGNQDYLADVGAWIVQHVPGWKSYATPDTWLYDHVGLGAYALAPALRLHWLFAYAFMLNGALYVVGLLWGGGYRSLLPRRGDLAGCLRMAGYYLGLAPARLLGRPLAHPVSKGRYNALQRSAYFAMPVCGALAVLTGWAIHKPHQLPWLAGMFGGYDWARVWHFWLMVILVGFTLPHVALVIADGWDTLRSMVVGWSKRIGESESG